MEIIGIISKEMLVVILTVVELIKKILPGLNDAGKIIVSLAVGAAVGYSCYADGSIENVLLAVGIGVLAGGEAAGIWKLLHEALKVIEIYSAAIINKKSLGEGL